MSVPPPRSRGLASPRLQARPAGLRSLSGAAGRSWPQSRPRLGPPRARRARLHGPGPGNPSRPRRRPHQAPGPGTSAGAGGGDPAAGGDRNLISQRRGLLPIPRRPRLFRGQHRRRQQRLLPDAPVGGGSREGRRFPSGPAWKYRLRRPAAATAATRSAEPARRVVGPSRGRARRVEEAADGGGPPDSRGRAHGFRFRFCLPGPGSVQRERAHSSPPPPTFLASSPLTSGSRLTRDPSAVRGAARAAPACRPRLRVNPRGRLRQRLVGGNEKVVRRSGGRWGRSGPGTPTRQPTAVPRNARVPDICTS